MTKNYSTEWDFRLGEKVKDKVTGFKGTITSRIEYLNGCRQYCVEPKVGKEGKMQKAQYVDEGQLVEDLTSKQKKASSKKADSPGGDMPNAPDKIGD